MKRSEIVALAMAQQRTPFRHQGRVPGLVLDCVGLYIHICSELGIEHIDTEGYARQPYDGTLERELDRQPGLEKISLNEAQAGDVLAMRISRAPQHIAIHAGFIDGHPYIIHSSEEAGYVCHHRLDSTWRHRLLMAYRFKGVDV
ncbi:NlpC/P60 family protein [Pseudomonas sp. YH-1]|uniref:NlpC/P60 family protein n=1 Tax=Pseudomonas sp. YH-1 TaxID=3384787 RepID=UPI003F7EA411